MALICLIGRHGSGKSAIGAELAKLGYFHISVGLLRRLSSANQFPSDFPVPLMLAMRRARPGVSLPADIGEKIVKFALSHTKCVIDGFPASLENLDQLPAQTHFGFVWVPRTTREDRLMLRSETSKRLWTPGRQTEREQVMAALTVKALSRGTLHFISNRADGAAAVQQIALQLAKSVEK